MYCGVEELCQDDAEGAGVFGGDGGVCGAVWGGGGDLFALLCSVGKGG